MRVLHLSTYDIRGGAARSAYRLHRGLLEAGIDSAMLVRRKSSHDDTVIELERDNSRAGQRHVKTWKRIQDAWIDARRTSLSNTLFSAPFPGFDVSQHPAVRAADVLHVHWIWWMLSPQAVAALAGTGKPIVWTFHDQRAFTGGCHFSAGCRGFERGCEVCPQLQPAEFSITAAALADTGNIVPAARITVVSPSRWLADCARASRVFARSRIEVIPYGVDTTVFRRHELRAAREHFGIKADAFCFLFGADNSAELRKGFGLLVEAFELSARDAAFRQQMASGNVQFVSFGAARRGAERRYPVPVLDIGRIDSDERLARLYSAVDALLLPSLEDNLPNVLLEAMCCGTPAVAFDAGGIPDAVTHEINGLLVPACDAAALMQSIIKLAGSPQLAAQLQKNCLRDAPGKYALSVQARRCAALYSELSGAKVESMAALPERAPFLAPGPETRKLLPRLLAGARRHRRRELLRRLFP